MVWKITAEELLARYAAGERNFAGVDLGGSHSKNIRPILSNVDLREIDLCGANLEMIDFCLSDLSGARLFGACLSYSYLIKTNFTGADLRYATIDWSNGREVNFTNANMQGIDLTTSNFSKSIWYSNNLKSAILIRTNLIDAQGWRSGSGDAYNALLWETIHPNGDTTEGPERSEW
ncbi:pentapeptide repeat-containing protein [Chamaesiphon minutus]|uniref:pentapeptide repeat-containing protein n=1 Tax=Chamaesiphon minutus TaxID=1173032 RepID=UPI000684C61F|nr:pentapeptide repeat-containing protein [Chamaesiphon minutus]